MRKRLPLLVGVLSSAVPIVWMTAITVEQTPAFIKTSVHESAVALGLLLFQSREAALAIEFPLFVVYCAIFGLIMGLFCKIILRWKTHEVG